MKCHTHLVGQLGKTKEKTEAEVTKEKTKGKENKEKPEAKVTKERTKAKEIKEKKQRF